MVRVLELWESNGQVDGRAMRQKDLGEALKPA